MFCNRWHAVAAALVALVLSLVAACSPHRPLPPGADPSLLSQQRGPRRGLQAAVRQPGSRACGVAPVSLCRLSRPRSRPPELSVNPDGMCWPPESLLQRASPRYPGCRHIYAIHGWRPLDPAPLRPPSIRRPLWSPSWRWPRQRPQPMARSRAHLPAPPRSPPPSPLRPSQQTASCCR